MHELFFEHLASLIAQMESPKTVTVSPAHQFQLLIHFEAHTGQHFPANMENKSIITECFGICNAEI